MMKKQAIIHTGLPKTGTTTIQKSLSSARDILLKNNILYPGKEDDHANLIARYHQMGSDHYYFKNRKIEDPHISASELIGEMEGCNGNLIISSEYLHDIDKKNIENLLRLMEDNDFDMQFVFYVRHPVDDAVSSSQQSIKMGQRSMGEVVENPRYTLLRKNISPFVEVAGKKIVNIRSFSSAVEKGLINDFLSILKIDEACCEISEVRSNESLSMDGAILSDMHKDYFEKTGRNLFSKNIIFKVGDHKFDLPEKSKRLIREQCQEDLMWMKDEFSIELRETVSPNRFHPNPSRDVVVSLIEFERRLRSTK